MVPKLQRKTPTDESCRTSSTLHHKSIKCLYLEFLPITNDPIAFLLRLSQTVNVKDVESNKLKSFATKNITASLKFVDMQLLIFRNWTQNMEKFLLQMKNLQCMWSSFPFNLRAYVHLTDVQSTSVMKEIFQQTIQEHNALHEKSTVKSSMIT
uniref:Uncharacterized protein n=1 Tax=Romanomermis culicivorax TaxID=13658 RepID=A0A915K8Y5_ROMCU